MTSPPIPHLTEKTFNLAKDFNTYVFKVDKNLNKLQIKKQLEVEYKVEVIEMHTLILKGKKARSIRPKSRRRVLGRRKDFKKAYATLKEGDVIPVFTDSNEKEGKPN